jgi:hypothetical protein
MVHLFILAVARSLFSKQLSQERILKMRQETMKMSYQATNLLVNLALGCFGLLHFTSYPFSHSPDSAHYTLLSRMTSHSENAIFGSLQMGYTLWSLPMGIIMVTESPAMILHHVSTLVTAYLTALFIPGFRYYSPFFFGVIELSSVPLAIMNYLKDHYEWTIQNAPTTYRVVRLVFALSFLWLRIILWVPQIYIILKALGMFAWTSPDRTTFLIVMLFWFTIFILTGLQWFWGWIVIKSLANVFINTFISKTKTKTKVN